MREYQRSAVHGRESFPARRIPAWIKPALSGLLNLVAVCAWSIATFANAAIAPVAHWRFDEPSGTTAFDSAGTNHGTLSPTGALFIPGAGISGGAIGLNRINNGFVNMGPIFPLTSGDYSLIAWIKMNAGDTAPSVAIDKSVSGYNNGYYLGQNVNGPTGLTNKAHFFAGGVFSSPVSPTTVNDGNWHQLVAVYKPSGQTSIFVDGALTRSSSASSPVLAGTANFLIGGATSDLTQPTGYFDGLIDEVQVYDRALSDPEIDFLFQNPGQEAQNLGSVGIPASPPIITTQPMNTAANAGTFANFGVTASGTLPLSYQWWKNGATITNATNAVLNLTNLTNRASSGLISVTITNAAGATTSSNALLRVRVPQQIQPPSRPGNGTFRLLIGDQDGSLLATNHLPYFRIQFISNLVSPNWVDFTNSLTLTNGMILFDDTNALSLPLRFYRITEQ